jgi:hypothetical protein
METSGMPEWSKQETIENSIKYTGSFNVSALVPADLKTKLGEKGIKSIDQLSGSDIYWFLLAKSEIKTTKNGKLYLYVTASGMDGKNYRIFCWGWNPKHDPPPQYSICAAEITVDDFGLKTFQNKIKVLRA